MVCSSAGGGRVLRAAFPHTVPVLTGYLVLGFAYGILMQQAGYGPLWTFLMSLLAFAGSMQYVAITLLTTAFAPLQAFLLSLMVNARHLFYGISMLEKYADAGPWRPYLIFTLTDETFSLLSVTPPPEGVEPRRFYLAVSALDHLYWVSGSVLGAAAGRLIHFDTTGLDFALTALFVVLFIEQLKDLRHAASGFAGVICAMAALLLFGPDNMVIPAMAFIVVILICGRKKLCI
ncbi:MAG: branched-chain amino acid transporter AzlC [Ruminococcaceae bacterium]|nr:branched-chain amino acid transporter AzlC [Oscillospiraceae bacterium]